MERRIYVKSIILLLLVGFVAGCAPQQYSANFQLKSHKSDRYVIEDQQEKEDDALISSVDKVTLEDEIVIKEIITEPEQIERLKAEDQVKVVNPQSKEELIKALKEDPEATVAFNVKDLTKKEKRQLKKEVKKQLKESKEAGVLQVGDEPNKLLYYILAVLLPPLAVGLWRGIGSDFWINLLLTLLFYLPGIIHAIIVISSKPKTTGAGAAY
ncbi:MAG: YqaE/Pmp3 family membrane protein [Candidatus Cyclobacteriaceae bacterium M2_1C_046]